MAALYRPPAGLERRTLWEAKPPRGSPLKGLLPGRQLIQSAAVDSKRSSLIDDILRQRRREVIGCLVSDPAFDELESEGGDAVGEIETALLDPGNFRLVGYDTLAIVYAKLAARFAPDRLPGFVRRAPAAARAEVARVLVWPEVPKPPEGVFRLLLALFSSGPEEEAKWARIMVESKGGEGRRWP